MNIIHRTRVILIKLGKMLPFILCALVLVSYLENIYALYNEKYLIINDVVILDKKISYFIGNDMLGDDGGHVVFRNYFWYDGDIYYNAQYTGEQTDYIAQMNDLVYRETSFCEAVLRSDYFANHNANKSNDQ